MDYIKRPKYLNKIEKFVDKPVIKVITGMRRVGKSTILKMISDEILKDVKAENKIFINFESPEFFKINSAETFFELILPKLESTNEKMYLFFDEVQLIKNWERVVNGIRAKFDVDIYITGSNSNLLSGDLATLLAGRYVEFEIQPFTFDEFKSAYKNLKLNDDELFDKFLKIGGMPPLKYFELDESTSYKYLSDIYNTVLVKDILKYNNIRDVDLFNRVNSFAIQNIGGSFSANSIKNFLKSESRKITVDTILNYLEYSKNAFILKKVSRYDVAGKKILKADEKYYLTDHGFRQANGFSNTRDIEKVLENIVYVELISRNYEVCTGRVENKEIDFIAKKENTIKYFQVSYLMENESTRERELGIYENIKDNFQKYVISMDKVDFSQNGIIHKNIIEFLTEGEVFRN